MSIHLSSFHYRYILNESIVSIVGIILDRCLLRVDNCDSDCATLHFLSFGSTIDSMDYHFVSNFKMHSFFFLFPRITYSNGDPIFFIAKIKTKRLFKLSFQHNSLTISNLLDYLPRKSALFVFLLPYLCYLLIHGICDQTIRYSVQFYDVFLKP